MWVLQSVFCLYRLVFQAKIWQLWNIIKNERSTNILSNEPDNVQYMLRLCTLMSSLNCSVWQTRTPLPPSQSRYLTVKKLTPIPARRVTNPTMGRLFGQPLTIKLTAFPQQSTNLHASNKGIKQKLGVECSPEDLAVLDRTATKPKKNPPGDRSALGEGGGEGVCFKKSVKEGRVRHCWLLLWVLCMVLRELLN